MTPQTLIDAAVELMQSQSALARHIGVSPSNVSDWRAGRRGIPAHHATKIAALIGVDQEAAVCAVTLARARQKAR